MNSWDAPKRGVIFNYFDKETVEHWGKLIDESRLNHWEGKALRGLLGDLRRLIETRDTLDELRADFGVSEGLPLPSARQREELHDRTRNFMAAYYGAMSHLNAVVARHSSIFGRVSFTEVGPFIKWLDRYFDVLSHPVVAELEAGRLFRALIEHPAQFPPNDWGTHVSDERQTVLVVFWGMNGRNGKVPAGAAAYPYIAPEENDWHFMAPDEVSLSNCVAHVAALLIERIVRVRWPGASFGAPAQMHRATVKAIGPWHSEFADLGLWEEVRKDEYFEKKKAAQEADGSSFSSR